MEWQAVGGRRRQLTDVSAALARASPGHARLRLPSSFAARVSIGGAAFFLFALIESRLLRSASIRLTTLGGASISGATISRPSSLAWMISRRPTWYSSL